MTTTMDPEHWLEVPAGKIEAKVYKRAEAKCSCGRTGSVTVPTTRFSNQQAAEYLVKKLERRGWVRQGRAMICMACADAVEWQIKKLPGPARSPGVEYREEYADE